MELLGNLNELLIHQTIWMHLKITILNENHQTKKNTYYIISFVEYAIAPQSRAIDTWLGWRQGTGIQKNTRKV